VEDYILGETGSELAFANAEDGARIALAMVSQARKDLAILSRDLDPQIYDAQAFVEAVSALCRRSRRSRVQILIQEPATVAKNGHRLLRLAQRLTSSIEMRKVAEDYQGLEEAYLIVDRTGVIYRPQGALLRGTANFDGRARARALAAGFQEIWDKSLPDGELQRLSL
jgi:hypothetical protein